MSTAGRGIIFGEEDTSGNVKVHLPVSVASLHAAAALNATINGKLVKLIVPAGKEVQVFIYNLKGVQVFSRQVHSSTEIAFDEIGLSSNFVVIAKCNGKILLNRRICLVE